MDNLLRSWGILRGIVAVLLVVLAFGTGTNRDAFAGTHKNAQANDTEIELTIEAPGDPFAEGGMLVEADEVKYNSETRIMEATGNVVVSNQERKLSADKLIYYEDEDRVVASGTVAITEANGEIYYAEEADLKNQMRDGVIKSLEAVLLQNARLGGNVAYRRDGTVNEITKGVYTSCNVCNEDGESITPKWQIRAFRVVQDKDKLKVTYRDVFFEVFGIPIFYTPYFSHADPSVKRKTGFLWPSWGTSDLLGTFVKTPYYFALSPYYDLTVTPTIMSEGEVLLENSWRQNFNRGEIEIDLGVINAKDRDDLNIETGDRQVQAHLFGRGRFRLEKNWRAGIDLELVNNDTYLRRYNINNRLTNDYNPLDLESRVFATRIKGRNMTEVNSYYFQGLRRNDDPGTIPIVLPMADTRFVWEPGKWGRVNFDASALVLQRSEGSDTRRLSLSTDWERRITTRRGQVLTPFASVRGDIYNTDDVPIPFTSETTSDTTFRALPTVGLDWRWPLVRPAQDKHFVIEPIVQAVASTIGGNDPEVPNEDSISFGFDTTNIFTPDRFPGFDRWEDGQRFNVGVKSGVYWDSGSHMNFTIGRSYRLQSDNPFLANSGLGTKESDYVGAIDVNIQRYLSINHQFRIDSEDGELKRNEVTATGNLGPLSGNVNYINAKQSFGVRDREEVNLSARVRLTKNWSVSAGSRRDLIQDRVLQNSFGIFYEDECTLVSLLFSKQSFVDRDITPDDAIIFNFILKSLN